MASCKQAESDPKPLANTSAVPAAAAAPSGSASASARTTTERLPTPASLAEKLPKAQLRQLLDTWLASQNTLDFEAYSKLYAERFTGIKRVGDKQRRYDRKGWLRDRRGMFKQGLRVQADHVEVVAGMASATLHFTQRFSTNTFRDSGPKRLLLVQTAQGLQIAREEMLKSKLLETEAESGESPTIWYAREDRVYLNSDVDDAAFAGKVHLLPNVISYVAERPLDIRKLTQQQQAFYGKAMVISAGDDEVCRARIVELRARAELVPHFGVEQRWLGISYGDDPKPKPATSREIADEVWRDGNVTLVGKLDVSCPEEGWATPNEATPVLATARVTNRVRNKLLGELAKLPEAKVIAKDFVTSTPERAGQDWLDHASLDFLTFETEGALQTVVASAAVGEDCSDIQRSLSVVFELDQREFPPRIVSRRVIPADDAVQIRGAIDLNQDGRLEFLDGPTGWDQTVRYWYLGKQGYEGAPLRWLRDMDCHC